jgi:hypothetical protein
MIRLLPFSFLLIALTGCILDHETKVTHEVYQMDPECLHLDSTAIVEDSSTFADSSETVYTTETRQSSCVIDLNNR